MNPSIIIGIGGTGKWTLTYLKKLIEDNNNGNLPEEVELISFDLTTKETPEVVIKNFKLEDGKVEDYSLDFKPTSKEFHNFSINLTDKIAEIKKCECKDESILNWFNKEDAEFFEGQVSTSEGAGQIRALSRLSLFLDIDDIVSKLYDKVLKIGNIARQSNKSVYIYIISSIAGGTGCGTILDFASLIHYCFKRAEIPNLTYYTFGFIVLPRAFESIEKGKSMENFKNNSLSAFRELHRYMTFIDHEFNYSETLKFKIENQHLFDIVYFIDGGASINEITKHSESVCPAISEYIYIYLKELSELTTLPNLLLREIRPIIQNLRGSIDIPIYSAFGIHKYIFEKEDIKLSFAHKISKDILNYFIKPGKYPTISNAILDFMKGSLVTPLERNFLYQIIEKPGSTFFDLKSLINHLKFVSTDDDISKFPELRIDDIDYGTLIKPTPFNDIKRQIDTRIKNLLGSVLDISDPKGGANTTHGYLNYYREKHLLKFKDALKQYMIDILNDDEREGCLLFLESFLDDLKKVFENIKNKFNDFSRDLSLESYINRYDKMVSQYEKEQKKKPYVENKKKVFELQQHQLTIKCISDIIDGEINIIDEFKNKILNWKNTFINGLYMINNSETELIKYRMSKRNIKIWTFVTEPNDSIENKLYYLIYGNNPPANDIESSIKEKLPNIDFKNLVNSQNGYFLWKFDGDELNCYLPKDFAPFEDLEKDPLKWNYNFINNYLKFGNLSELDNISIFDILKLKKVDINDLNNYLNTMSLVMLHLDESKRPSLTDVNLPNISKKKYTISNFTVSEPGKSFSTDFINKLKDSDSEILDYDFYVNEIIQYQIYDFISFCNITNLQKNIDTYRRINKNGRHHVFAEEKNAFKLEEKFKEIFNIYPGEEYGIINYNIVDNLTNINLLTLITFSKKYKWIYYDSGHGNYRVRIPKTVGENEIILGKNYIDVLIYLNRGEMKDDVIDYLTYKYDEIFSSLKTKEDINKFIDELKKFILEIDNEIKDEESRDLKELLNLMKLIAYQEIEEFLERLKKIR